MNILFIGPYRQSDGWGLAAQDYISCLGQLEDHNVSCAPIYMSNNITRNIPSNILELENTTYDKFDIVIQNVLPNFFEKYDAYNIGIYYSETKNLQQSLFIDNINLLDELWVSSESEQKTLHDSGVTIPIHIVPIPLNTKLLEENENNLTPLEIPNLNTSFNFYMVAEYTERKNIESVIIAYNREFSNEQNVNLILKTKINGFNDQQNEKKILEDIHNTKIKLRLYGKNLECYANEILINQTLSYPQILSLHNSCDCLLVPSRGEAYCKPALEAIYFGSSVICTEGIHTCSILKDRCTTVESMEVPIFIGNPPAPHIYTGWETWDEISIIDLQAKMRQIFEDKRVSPKDASREWVKNNFSYNAINKKIRDRLCQLSKT